MLVFRKKKYCFGVISQGILWRTQLLKILSHLLSISNFVPDSILRGQVVVWNFQNYRWSLVLPFLSKRCPLTLNRSTQIDLETNVDACVIDAVLNMIHDEVWPTLKSTRHWAMLEYACFKIAETRWIPFIHDKYFSALESFPVDIQALFDDIVWIDNRDRYQFRDFIIGGFPKLLCSEIFRVPIHEKVIPLLTKMTEIEAHRQRSYHIIIFALKYLLPNDEQSVKDKYKYKIVDNAFRNQHLKTIALFPLESMRHKECVVSSSAADSDKSVICDKARTSIQPKDYSKSDFKIKSSKNSFVWSCHMWILYARWPWFRMAIQFGGSECENRCILFPSNDWCNKTLNLVLHHFYATGLQKNKDSIHNHHIGNSRKLTGKLKNHLNVRICREMLLSRKLFLLNEENSQSLLNQAYKFYRANRNVPNINLSQNTTMTIVNRDSISKYSLTRLTSFIVPIGMYRILTCLKTLL